MKSHLARKTAVLLLLMTVALMNFRLTGRSEAQGLITIGLEPAVLQVTQGEVFNITVYMTNLENVFGVEFTVSWDPTVLECIGMEEILYHNVTPPEEWGNIWKIRHVVADDYIWYAYTWMDMTSAFEKGYAPISGNHTVATITLNATAPVGSTYLRFEYILLGDPDYQPIIWYEDSEFKKGECRLVESSILVGNPPPVINILSPSPNILYTTSDIDLIFTVNEETSWISYSIDGQSNVTIEGNCTISVGDGAHTLTIYASDPEGNVGATSVEFKVDALPPVASFTYSPEEPKAEKIFGTYKWNMTFNASSSYDLATKIVSYQWDFGDGTQATGVVVSHLFRAPGTYNVTLAVIDVVNHVGTNTVTITIPAPPIEIPWGLVTIILIPVVWIIALALLFIKQK